MIARVVSPVARARAWLVAWLALVLAACGGGDGGMMAGGGIIGTGDAPLFAKGILSATAPGRITVNGVAMDTRQASVSVDGLASSTDALKVGMVVTVDATVRAGSGAVVASRIDYVTELRGVVDGVDSALRAFSVLGQQVRTDAATVYEGGSFDTLIRQWVVVSGLRGADGVMLATRVAISAPPGGATVQVAGLVSAFDSGARTFRVGGTLVDFASASLPAAVRDGASVRVVGAASASGDRLVASAVTLESPAPIAEGTRAEIEGLVGGYLSLARFEVDGQRVDATGALVEGGSTSMVVDGARVEVEGTLRSGVLVATKLEIKTVPTVAIEGIVDAIDAAASSFSIAGQLLRVTEATQFADASSAPVAGFGFAAIVVGDRMAVRAQRHSNGLVATRVERRDRAAPPASTPTRVEGVVSAFVSAADFVVGTQRVNAASARFENGTAAELRDGRRVEVEGILSGQVLLATRLGFVAEPPVTPVAVEIEGAISGFVSAARFRVAGQVIDASGARFSGGTAADLADGRLVTVRGVVAGTLVQAGSVEFHGSVAPTTAELEGTVTDFVSIADFRVEGQRVDASSARFTGGTASAVRNGRRVHVTGPLTGGIVRAATVEIEDDVAGVEASVEGRISAYVSVADFTVSGRVVDASAAVFENGTPAGLRVGRTVHVEGRLVGAVLRASKVALE